MTIDPRLLERRKTVAEDNAHRNVGRLLRFLAGLALVAVVVWLLFSPWLSVARVNTTGVVSSEAHAILADHQVVAGAPMVLVDTGEVEAALITDPWIKEALVMRQWPDEVLVRVTERVPVLWVESSQGWSRRAVDGVALPGPDTPEEDAPRLLVPTLLEADLETSPLVTGAAEFVDALPSTIAEGVSITVEEGELWAEAAGHQVRLGRPVEMAEKALSLTALLAEDLPQDAVIIVVAPTHPAVDLPDRTADREQPETGEGEDAGTTGEQEDDDS